MEPTDNQEEKNTLEGKPITIIFEDNNDIPPIPVVQEKKEQAQNNPNSNTNREKDDDRKRQQNNRRQREYKSRISEAKMVAPMVGAALNQYIKMRGVPSQTLPDGSTRCFIDANDPDKLIPYWSIEEQGTSVAVHGTLAEAMAFHGLAGSDGLTRKFFELMERYPSIFGMIGVVICMGYLELQIISVFKYVEQQSKQEAQESPETAGVGGVAEKTI